MRTVYIYALTEPDGTIRYIGQALNTRTRYNSHVCITTEPRTHKEKWINSLLRDGKRPVLIILKESDEENSDADEISLIRHYRDIGSNLTNGTDGGDGVLGYKWAWNKDNSYRNYTKGKLYLHTS